MFLAAFKAEMPANADVHMIDAHINDTAFADKALEIFRNIQLNQKHIIIVAEINGRIVGATTLLIEPKFIHQGGIVGHIEDVVVDKEFQGQKIGEKIIKYVLGIAKNNDCYKTILDCSDDVKQFYEKLGFKPD